MDTKFQTSFIPRKSPVVSAGRMGSSMSIFLIVAIIIFLLTISAAAGVYIYRKVLLTRIDDVNSQLVKAKNFFETSFISKATVLNRRIEASKQLLVAHTALSPVFDLLANETLATIRFDYFNYDVRDGGDAVLRLSGQGKYFSSVALQSDIFGQEKFLKNPVFSDLNPDASGNIVFKFVATVDPKLISYLSTLSPQNK
jgi:hypothetical protein